MKKRILQVVLIFSLLHPYLLALVPMNSAEAATTTNIQSIQTVILSEIDLARPGTYWTQMDNGSFRATYTTPNGSAVRTAPRGGPDASGSYYPQHVTTNVIDDDINLSNYYIGKWEYNGSTVSKSVVTDIKLYSVEWITSESRAYTPVKAPEIVNDTVARFSTITGGPNYSDNYMTYENGVPTGKWQTLYRTPVEIKWAGKLTETKEIDVIAQKTSMGIGGTQQLSAVIKTNPFTSLNYTYETGVTNAPETIWTSSNSSVLSVTNGGQVTAHKNGTATITATWTQSVQVQEMTETKKSDGTVVRTLKEGLTTVTYNISDSVTITVSETGDGGSGPNTFTGDFEVTPTTINWRDSFSITPKNFNMNGCVYVSHQYKIERDGLTWTSSAISGQNTTSTYTFSNYPYVIGVGYHNVYMKIKTSNCGDSDWIGPKGLDVNGPTDNRPPQGLIGFVHPYDNKKPLNKVVEGTALDLILINDPSVPTPFDPDEGDSIYFEGFDFSNSSSWAKTIPSISVEYGDGYHNITMSQLGYHQVRAVIRDDWGASTTLTTWIEVVPKNPEPVASCPAVVISNHPIDDSLFSSHLSSSPIGLAIDHTRDEWINKQSVYINESSEDITVSVFLHVYDSEGLKSLEPDECIITVKPDLPPIAKLTAPTYGIRDTEYDVFNNSYSPDGDPIVSTIYRMRYDRNNNGFADDTWTVISGSVLKTVLSAEKVGKYEVMVEVTEKYGKSASAAIVIDTVNLAPTVSFVMEGRNDVPEAPIKTPAFAADIYRNWSLYQINTTNPISKAQGWSADWNTLSVGLGKFGESIETKFRSYSGWGNEIRNFTFNQYIDSGNGSNTVNSYRAINGNIIIEPLTRLISVNADMTGANGTKVRWDHATFMFEGADSYIRPWGFYFKSSPTHLYYTTTYTRTADNPQYQGESLLAYNYSKMGNFSGGMTCLNTNCTSLTWVNGYDNNQHPIDFMLDPEDLRDARPKKTFYWWNNREDYKSGDVSKAIRATERTLDRARVLGYVVGEKTIYQIVTWECESCTWISYTSESVTELVGDIRTYDAQTGELIQSTLLNGLNVNNIVNNLGFIGKNQVFTRGDIMIWFQGDGVFEIYPDGHATWKPSPINTSAKLFRGPDGEWYYYKTVKNTSGTDIETYLVQIKPDYTIGWEVKLKGMSPTPGIALAGQLDQSDNNHMVYVNPVTREIITRSYSSRSADFGTDVYYEAINIDTREKRDWDNSQYPFTSINGSMSSNWEGDYFNTLNQFTADGYRTYRNGNEFRIYDTNNTLVRQFSVGNQVLTADSFYATTADVIIGGVYVGDGVYLAFMNVRDAVNYQTGRIAPFLIKGAPTTNPKPYSGFYRGQFMSPMDVTNAEISWNMALTQPAADAEFAGMSFRMGDPQNRYAVETNGTTLHLSKYVNGERTVLESTVLSMQSGVIYNFKIRFVNDKIEVYVGGAPYFEVTDDTFTDGSFGLFSDKAYVDFSSIAYLLLKEPQTEWLSNYAIWESGSATAEVRYDSIVFNDPEKDPIAGNYQWRVQHTPRFINNQGLSQMDGKTFESPILQFDAVGVYTVYLKGEDDPHPDYPFPDDTFGEYRKLSNDFGQVITVHRRPIAQFTLTQAEDGKVLWTDTSYDPDRFEDESKYSAEETGIDYKATKGVLEKKFYYTTPSGASVIGKLTQPEELGLYEVGMAVKDEYDAWSEYAVVYLNVTKLPEPNNPPTPGFTLSHTTTYRGVEITIDSTAFDIEDGDRTTLPHQYYIRNTTTGSAESLQSTSRTTWSKTFNSLGVFTIRQVIRDSQGATTQLEQQVTIHNRLPVANVITPNSTNQNNPTRLFDLQPTFNWAYSDADQDSQKQYQVRVYRYGGVLQMDSSMRTGAVTSWTPSGDLPEKTNLYVQVRVHDGYDWGDWSGAKFFYIETNRPPTGDFTWSPSTVYEGDTVQFRTAVSDADGDTLSVAYEITAPSGTKSDSSYTIGSPYTSHAGPSVRMDSPGNWTVRMTVSDGKAPAVAVTKTVRVDTLHVVGAVKHTDAWEENRLAYNATNHPDRPPNMFWAGEAFVLEASTTDTGAASATKASSVVVQMFEGNIKSLTSTDSAKASWSGLLRSADTNIDFTQLADGNYTFLFTATYSNGTVKTDQVTITIKDSTASYVQVHRLH